MQQNAIADEYAMDDVSGEALDPKEGRKGDNN